MVMYVKRKDVARCCHGVIAITVNMLVWNTHENS